VADGVVYTGAEDGFLYAIDEQTGKELWKYDTQQDVVGTPTISNGTAYVAKPGGPLFALDAKTGAERFSFDTPQRAGVTPAAVDGTTLYVGSPDSSFYALNAITGELEWSFATQGRITGTPAIVDDVLYGASFDNHLYALDATTGAELWNLALDGSIDFGPSVADGAVYVSTSSGTVYAIGGPDAPDLAATPQPSIGTVVAVPATDIIRSWAIIREGAPIQGMANLAIAPDGNVWVLDVQTGRFSIYAPDGSQLGQWGTPGSKDGQFDFALTPDIGSADFAFGPDGSLYVVDIHQRVQQFAPDLTFVRSWGGIGRGDGQFLSPHSVAVDNEGNIYVVDDERGDVQKFDASGNYLLSFGGPDSGLARFASAGSIAVGFDDTIWVTDRSANRIEGFSPDGVHTGEITSEMLSEPSEITTDPSGNLYVVNQGSYRVTIFDPAGNLLASLDGINNGGDAFDGLDGVATDGQGNVYATNWTSPNMQNPSEALQKFAIPGLSAAATPVAATPVA
jgi:outer membrane protein assembly factor BamB